VSQHWLSIRRALVAVTTVALAVSGCTDEATPAFEPVSEFALSAYTTQVGDSVYWDSSGVMAFYDDVGTYWWFKRVQNSGAWDHIQVYRDSVYLGDVDVSSYGSDELRFVDPYDTWIETDTTSGTIYYTSYGDPGSGGGEGCDDPEAIICDGVTAMSGGDCDEEFDEMQDDAWQAVGAGAIAAFSWTVAPGTPISIGLAVGFGIKTGDALGSVFSWGACKLGFTSVTPQPDYTSRFALYSATPPRTTLWC
jgi:hypothetical protein